MFVEEGDLMSEQNDGAGMAVQGKQISGSFEGHGQEADLTLSKMGST